MKNNERERQSKFRGEQQSKSKTPLTFYRSAGAKTDSRSPFRTKEAESKPGKIRSFFAGFLDAVVVFALFALLAYSLVVRPSARVELNSQLFHKQRVYEAYAGKILGDFSYSNKITFSEQNLVTRMQKQFPEIASARVELPILAQTPVIHLRVASPSFILKSGGQSYIVDSEGAAVAKSSDFPSVQNLLEVDDQSGFPSTVGKQVMSADSVRFIKTLEAQSKHANVKLGALTLPKTAQELELRTVDRPYYVKFYLGGNVLQQAGQFLAARHQFDASSTQPAEYLDVRVPGKIFYK
jgi:hypothetical protein